MILITSLFVVELYFFSMNLKREQLTLVLNDWRLKSVRMRREFFLPICIISDDKKFSFNLNRNEKQF